MSLKEYSSPHLTLFLHAQLPSFMSASSPSSARPMGLQLLLQGLLDPQLSSDLIYWCSVWFLQTETRGWQRGNFLVVVPAARLVGGHVCSLLLPLAISSDYVFRGEAFWPLKIDTRAKLPLFCCSTESIREGICCSRSFSILHLRRFCWWSRSH